MAAQQSENGGVAGFRFSSVAAGIRKDGRIDLALAVTDGPCVVAGVFTRNLVRAAPVTLSERRLAVAAAGTESVRGVLVNAGCANACTGEAGMAAAQRSTAAVARALSLGDDALLPASTGVIGALLPAEKIEARAKALVTGLSADGADGFSRAILTTDRWPKVTHEAVETAGGGAPVTLLGIAKGAGMIHPDMGPPQATMLAFFFTDAQVDRPALQTALERAVDESFNQASVDGDTSTNDCALVFASGASGRRPAPGALEAALTRAGNTLARSMVADGEGANHVAEILVQGSSSDADARQIARTVATSLLVKTALFGKDVNWGRLLAAAGRAGVPFDPTRARIAVGDVDVVRGGVAVGADAEVRANQVLARDSYAIVLELGDGPGRGRYLTSDLGHGYVDVNAGYRS